jgi:hypothetical protein
MSQSSSLPIDKNLKDAFNILPIKSMDFRTIEEKNREENLICSFISNKYVYYFACNLIYKIIQVSINYLGKQKTIKTINSKFVNALNTDNITEKLISIPGYLCGFNNQCEEAIDIVTTGSLFDFYTFNKSNNISISQLMGIMFSYQYNNDIGKLIIKNDPDLSEKFVKTVCDYFSIPYGISFDELTTYIDESYGTRFYLWTMYHLYSDKRNLITRALSAVVPDYILEKEFSLKYDGSENINIFEPINVKDMNDPVNISCRRNAFSNYADSEYLISGLAYKKPRQNGVWFNIMKSYNKQILSGPSGSCIFTFEFVFMISKILDDTFENKLMLLICILSDYYNYYHSISEVLQEYSDYATFDRYDLSENDVDYINSLIEKAGSIEEAVRKSIIDIPSTFNQVGASTGKKRKTRRNGKRIKKNTCKKRKRNIKN